MENQVEHSLITLGLSPREALVYKALLSLKKGSVLTIAKLAGIKRPTAYHVLASLKQKGLISVTAFRGVKDYRALPVEALKKYVRQQKQLAEKHLPEMERVYEKRKQKLRLRVYSDLSAVKTLLEKSLREKSRLHVIGREEVFASQLGAYWQFYLKRSRQLGLDPKFKPHTGEICLLLWSDKVAFVRFGEKIQTFGFKNKAMHDLYFDLWKNC